jgi:hypothetical protein
VLLQQLDNEAARTRDRLQRSRIATARAIIADPQRRAAYDRHLADPSVEITEETLAQISGRPVPTAGPLSGQRGVLALGIAAGSLVLALVVAIAIVATAGGDDGDPPASAAAASSAADASPQQNYDINDAYWKPGRSSAPRVALRLDAAYDLPDGVGPLVANTGVDLNCANSVDCRLARYRNGNLGLYVWDRDAPDGQKARLVVLDQNGAVLSDKTYDNNNDVPLTNLDTRESAVRGYFRITAADVTIPAAANGTEHEMVSTSVVLPDAAEDNTFWVLLRGGDKLYKGSLVAAS